MFLDPLLHLDLQVAAVARSLLPSGEYLSLSEAHTTLSFKFASGHHHPCLQHLKVRLLQGTLCRAALENHPEAVAGTQHDGMTSGRNGSSGTRTSSSPEYALAPNCFLGAIQSVNFDQ